MTCLQPFPLNPSFKPPTPLSDQLRTLIYNEYMTNPELYNVRVLSERHGISIQRVDAILRLKGMEESWKKVRHHCFRLQCALALS